MATRKQMRAEAAAAAETETEFERALTLFVAHCGGDVGKATVDQRKAFDAALIEFAANAALGFEEQSE